MDQEIRLVHSQVGQEGVQKARQEYADLKQATEAAGKEFYDLADSAKAANSPVYELANTVAIVSAKATESRPGLSAVDLAMEEVAASSERAALAVGKVSAAQALAVKGTGNLAQGVTAAGYAFQDFTSTSGDLGAKLNSITNNLPTLVAGLGYGGPLGAGVAALGVGAIVLYRNWDSLTGLFESRNPFPEAARDVAFMRNELDKAKDAMKKLEENTSLTDTQLRKYNELRATTATLEKEIADQEERQATIKKGLESKSQEQEDRASAFGKAQAGQGAEVRAGIRSAYEHEGESEYEKMKERSDERVDKMYDEYLAGAIPFDKLEAYIKSETDDLKQWKAAIKSSAEKLTDDLYAGLLTGAEGAVDKLKRLDETGAAGFGDLLTRINANLPETKKAAEKAKGQAKAAADLALKQFDDGVKDILDEAGDQLKEAAVKAIRAKKPKAAVKDDVFAKALEVAQGQGRTGQDAEDMARAAAADVMDPAARAARAQERAAQNKAAGAADRGQKKDDKAATRSLNDRLNETVKTVSAGTSLDEESAAIAARMRAEGRGTNAQQFDALAAKITQALRAGDMNGMMAQGVGGRMADQAFKGVDAATAARQTQLVGQGVDMNVAGQQAVGEVLQAMQAIAIQQQQAQQGWGAIAQAARAIRSKIKR